MYHPPGEAVSDHFCRCSAFRFGGGSLVRLNLDLRDYLAFPITGKLDGTGQTDGMLARVNSLREEPGGASRFFVNDLNGPLYILDKKTKQLTTYLDFNGRDGRPGLFHKLRLREPATPTA